PLPVLVYTVAIVVISLIGAGYFGTRQPPGPSVPRSGGGARAGQPGAPPPRLPGHDASRS
ncbi:hypothetical protein ABZ513_30970, partial [Streptomyces bacillaris]